MNEEQFIAYLKQEIDEIKKDSSDIKDDHGAFLYWFLKEIFRLENDEILDSIVDGAEDKGIDAIYITPEDIYIIQALFTEKFDSNLPETKIIKTFNGIRWLKDGDLSKVNPVLREKGMEYRDTLITYFPKVHIIFVTSSLGPVNNNVF